MEQPLPDSDASFRELFFRAQDAMAIHTVGPDEMPGPFVEVNEASCRLFGYSREEHLRRSPMEMMVPDEPAVMGRLLELLRHDEAVTFEATARCNGGRELPIEVSARALRWQGGRAVLASARDLTARRQLEAQLRQAQKMESIGRLAGGVAHDFNNLMTAILGHAELAQLGLPKDDPTQDHLEQIREAVGRAALLTRQLLAFSRRQLLEPRLVDLNQLVRAMDRWLRRSLGEDVELGTVTGDDPLTVRVDPVQIEQVLVNLAVNARDAMPAGGRLTLRTSRLRVVEPGTPPEPELRPGDYALLEVADTGHGLSEEARNHLFEPFFTTKEPGKGTGLGLATAYGIVRQHQGRITVRSEPGRGATFTICLPAVAAEDAAIAPAPARHSAEVHAGHETVLVVEDDPAVRPVVVEQLRQFGYTVLEAACAEEAERRLAEHPGASVDLLLSDVVMPRVGGRELAERLRRRLPRLRVLLVSGYAEDAALSTQAAADGMAFLGKPFNRQALGRKIRELLDTPA